MSLAPLWISYDQAFGVAVKRKIVVYVKSVLHVKEHPMGIASLISASLERRWMYGLDVLYVFTYPEYPVLPESVSYIGMAVIFELAVIIYLPRFFQ